MNNYWTEETCDCVITIESDDVVVGKSMFVIRGDEVLVATSDNELFMAIDTCTLFQAKVTVNKMLEIGWNVSRTSHAWIKVLHSSPNDDDIKDAVRNMIGTQNHG